MSVRIENPEETVDRLARVLWESECCTSSTNRFETWCDIKKRSPVVASEYTRLARHTMRELSSERIREVEVSRERERHQPQPVLDLRLKSALVG